MKIFRQILCLVIGLSFLPERASALDYQPTWDFLGSIGDQGSAFGSASLTYSVPTGELVYRIGESDRWAPPDIGSISGLLLESVPLHPVPIWGTPTFSNDEEFDGSVVPESNAIRIHADNWAFWPWWPDDPFILQHFGLESVPQVYNYGPVLPKGLTKELLSNELYATAFPMQSLELRVVPEPSWIASVVVGATLLGISRAFQKSIA